MMISRPSAPPGVRPARDGAVVRARARATRSSARRTPRPPQLAAGCASPSAGLARIGVVGPDLSALMRLRWHTGRSYSTIDMERTRSGGGTVRETLCIGSEETVEQTTWTDGLNCLRGGHSFVALNVNQQQ